MVLADALVLRELTQGAAYEVIGVFLGVPYPVTYDDVGFPRKPGGVSKCTACHNPASDGWKLPASLVHPSAPLTPARSWALACRSCHDSALAGVHVEGQTTVSGAESCQVCHGLDDDVSVEKAHFVP